jgi:hypothetical protein
LVEDPKTLKKIMGGNLTRWFGESVRPVNIGVYQVRVRGNRQQISYAFWDGINWGFPHSFLSDFVSSKFGPDHAASRRQGSAVAPQDNEWRGIMLKQ